MTGNEILKADMLDILFDKRNKDYGAYTLRKFYSNRLILSLGIALGSVFFLFLFMGTTVSTRVISEGKGPVILRDAFVPQEKKKIEPAEPKKKVAAAAQAAPQKKYLSRLDIVDDNKLIDQKLVANRDIDDFTPSDVNLEGIPGGPKISQRINTSGGDGILPTKTPSSEAPLINRDPEFPGGVQAWLRFLTRNLQVPDDLAAGEKKTVLIRFVVAIDGGVTGFQVIQSGGKYYDDEVIRVLKKMPKWKPALQSSQPVAVAFTQPVTFMGVGE